MGDETYQGGWGVGRNDETGETELEKTSEQGEAAERGMTFEEVVSALSAPIGELIETMWERLDEINKGSSGTL